MPILSTSVLGLLSPVGCAAGAVADVERTSKSVYESTGLEARSTSAKPRFPWKVAWAIAGELRETLATACERIVIAGSLRRRKPGVGDIELLYIPRIITEPDPADMFASREVNLADRVIAYLTTARAMGMKGSPYGGGFSQSGPCAPHGESSTMAVPEARPTLLRVTSERGVFECVGLPYAEPWERR